MTFVNGLKRLCDICFYMTFASIISGFLGVENLIITLPFFAITAFLGAYLAPHGKKQYFSILPLALAFLVTSFDFVSVVTLVPAIIYTIATLPKKDEQAAMFEYEAPFKIFIVVYGWILAFVIVMDTLPGDASLPTDSYLFALTFLLNAIIFTRMIRHDAVVYNQNKFKLLNVIPMIGIISITILLSTNFFRIALSRTWGFIWTNLLFPALEFLVSIISIPFLFLARLLSGDGYFVFMMPEPPEDFHLESVPGDLFAASNESLFGGLIALILIIVIIISIYLLFKYLMNQKLTYTKTDDDVEEVRTAIIPESRSRNPFNRNKLNPIRKIYRDYLVMVTKNGVKLLPHYTSAEIETVTHQEYGDEKTAKLRDEYIQYRYRETGYTKADIKRLEKLHREIKAEIMDKG